MKKLLALALALCMIFGSCGALAFEAGETVEVSFSVTSDTGDLSLLRIKLEYDHEALEQLSVADKEGVRSRLIGPKVSEGFDFAAVFRIREEARPGVYPVTVRVIEALDNSGAEIPEERFPTYSEAAVTVKHPPVDVSVYYYVRGNQLDRRTVTLPAGEVSTVKADIPEGYVADGPAGMRVSVAEDGKTEPEAVIFMLATCTPTPGPTALPGIRLEITRKIGSNTLKWNRVPGAERYRVYRSTSGYANYTLLDTVSAISYTDTAIKAGMTYYYKVEAVFPNGQTVADQKSIVSATATSSPTPTPTPTPTPLPGISLEITREIGSNTLKWKSVPGAEGYRVYRSTSVNANYNALLENVSGLTYTATAVKAGATYYYRVEAVFPNGETVSAQKSIVAATATPSPTPTPTSTPTPLPGISLRITAKIGSNTLKWNSVPGAERYRVYRGTSDNGNYDILATVSGTSYTDTGVKAGATYYYLVEAVFPNGQTVTDHKSIVSATATPSPTPKPTPTPVPVKVGGYITFGHFEQDNNTRNGKEPIEWLVLDVRGNQALVISKYGLDAQRYNSSTESVTWETCSLRKWLNGEFLNNAFTAGEQKAIIRTKVDNGAGQGYSEWKTDGGNNTEDRIFLLSYAEAWRYFSSDSARQCRPTRYAEGRGAYTYSSANYWWWLRSPGPSSSLACIVRGGGAHHYFNVDNSSGCVRPALWINLDSGIF